MDVDVRTIFNSQRRDKYDGAYTFRKREKLEGKAFSPSRKHDIQDERIENPSGNRQCTPSRTLLVNSSHPQSRFPSWS